MAEDEDPVAHEIDVYLSKHLSENLYLFQYPVRPASVPYDDVKHLAARIKPKQQKVELELELNTRSNNYARSKGEQIALNVDGPTGGGEGSYFTSDKMDKQVLASTTALEDTSRYAVGVLKHGELHLTPLSGIIQLRPSFDYLDRVDNKQRELSGAAGDGGESSQDEEEEVKPVTVRFSRVESEEAKARRMASYEYMHKKHEEEAWMHVEYHEPQDSLSARTRTHLIATQTSEVTELHVPADDYLQMLIPKADSEDKEKPALPSNVLSMSQLKNMTLGDQIKALLTNAKVIRFNQLLALLPKETEAMSALRSLQQVAVLVQGCWVVKSEVLYPKDTCSAQSGAPAEVLCRGRDFAMWKFTQSRFIVRKELTAIIKLPTEDVKEILEQMSRVKIHKGWEFIMNFDSDFVNRYPEVVQRQNMLWEAKYQQLCRTLHIGKDGEKKLKGEMGSPPPQDKPKRRRTTSRSRTKSGDKSMSDMSDSDIDQLHSPDSGRRRRKSSCTVQAEPMDTSSHLATKTTNNGATYHIENGPELAATVNNDMVDNTLSMEFKTELLNFVKEKLHSRFVLSISELKRLFTMKLAQSQPGYILATGVSEKLLEQTVIEVGAERINQQRQSGVSDEPIFVLGKIGDEYDQIRQTMISLFQNGNTNRLNSGTLKKKLEEETGEIPDNNDVKKILRDYCVAKSSLWYLKGSFPVTDS